MKFDQVQFLSSLVNLGQTPRNFPEVHRSLGSSPKFPKLDRTCSNFNESKQPMAAQDPQYSDIDEMDWVGTFSLYLAKSRVTFDATKPLYRIPEKDVCAYLQAFRYCYLRFQRKLFDPLEKSASPKSTLDSARGKEIMKNLLPRAPEYTFGLWTTDDWFDISRKVHTKISSSPRRKDNENNEKELGNREEEHNRKEENEVEMGKEMSQEEMDKEEAKRKKTNAKKKDIIAIESSSNEEEEEISKPTKR
jgi:hypothetical protein